MILESIGARLEEILDASRDAIEKSVPEAWVQGSSSEPFICENLRNLRTES